MKQTDNADNYAAKQMMFVDDGADYNADSDNTDDFAKNGRQRRQWITTKMMDKDAHDGRRRRMQTTDTNATTSLTRCTGGHGADNKVT